MSTVDAKTKFEGVLVFRDHTASEQDDCLVVVDCEGETVARFNLAEVSSWWSEDD